MPRLPSIPEFVNGILSGDRLMLARGITLVESTLPAHRAIAQSVMRELLPHTGHSVRIGITGVPGVGKSTFIEAFGGRLLSEDERRRLAVLTIDPTSRVSGGSILGDKTRMETLCRHPRAFVRPSPAGHSLGGVAARTREAMLLCEAAGFDWIVVETVGVGQSETTVHDMCDLFLLLLLPGAGDELQGIKRGIVEMADLVAVNKADGHNAQPAQLAAQQYRAALHLYPKKENDWAPEVLTCSAATGLGLDEIREVVERYLAVTRGNGSFALRRAQQRRQWFEESLLNGLQAWFFARPEVQQRLAQLQQAAADGTVSPFWAAEELLREVLGSDK